MLCQGCVNAVSRELPKTSAAKKNVPGGAFKKGVTPPPHADFWEGELGQENVHPLQAALPNSVWEKYNKSCELQGREPFLPAHYAEAEARGEDLPGDSEPLGVAEQAPESSPRQTRLRLWRRNRGKKASLRTTAALPEMPHPDVSEMHQHLIDHHHYGAHELEGDEQEDLLDKHELVHAAGLPDELDHTHPEGGPQHPSEPSHEILKHPSKFTVSSLHSHLLEDHGINPDHMENAINGTLEGTHGSHVVQMMHDKAHADGQIKNLHSHEGWEGGQKVHEGHQDLGKPFWGAPPATADKGLAHLSAPVEQGGHGIPASSVSHTLSKSGVDSSAGDVEYSAAVENLHGNLHKAHGASIEHQHVPTVQPGVKTPAQIEKEQLQQHLKDHHGVANSPYPKQDHGVLHDPTAYGYNGHPGHEHDSADPHGPITQAIPKAPSQYPHVSAMSHSELIGHLYLSHKDPSVSPGDHLDALNHLDSASHEELVQHHALKHTLGHTDGHEHVGAELSSPLDQDPHYGAEPEIQTKTHPAIDSEHEALTHILKHHPNVGEGEFKDWKSLQIGSQQSMVNFHQALHDGGKTSMGNTLPKPIDGHDHAEPDGPPTTIPIGSHLVSHHGMDQSDVAAMSPAEFKAHHEMLHLKKPESEIGHGHDYPGGPARDPRLHLPNTHHEMFRDDSKHPATQEWYHGTGTEYEGAPKNATELMHGHGFWGNYGGGDWNNHAGTHWTSLHEMAANFGPGGGGRVIHARLHIRNPVTYNSLNHMSHDAYDRLRASGHLQDDGEYEDNHDDDSGYNHCCSDTLLAYAKGHHRDDGKFGMEAYRDSLRASGYDGIHVRNQADSPYGHWNAIPLSADQIEITHGGCRGSHGDERDNDNREFNNQPQATKGWIHPKSFNHSDYAGPSGELPDGNQVAKAHADKKSTPLPFKSSEGRGDTDPHLGGRSFVAGDDDGDDEEHYCEHCDEHGDHESKDCQYNKWCGVCGEHGDHEDSDEHPYCEHCGDYSEHSSEDHEDEYGEHPDTIRKEGYCPHCDSSTKENYNSSDCKNCGEKLPDWGKLTAHGEPVKNYDPTGDTAEADYKSRDEAPLHPSDNEAQLAAHLYHHHKSDVGGKAFDNDGGWDGEALKYHHQWLHQNPGEAKERGFVVDHDHKQKFGQFPQTDSMSPESVHSHMLMSHCGSGETYSMPDVMGMTSGEAVEAHKKLHEADDAVHWGQKNEYGELIPKIKHTHDLEGEQGSFDEAHYPTGDKLQSHLTDSEYHLGISTGPVPQFLKENPKVAEALHSQMHKNFGPASQPGQGKFHVHGEELDQQIADKQKVKDHLSNDHGANMGAYAMKGKSLPELMAYHHNEHTHHSPQNGIPDHSHIGGTDHQDPSGHSAETMKKIQPPEAKTSALTLTALFEEVAL